MNSALIAGAPDGDARPDWFLEEISRVTADDGRWVADNSACKCADEPFDAFGVEWFFGDLTTSR